MFGLRYRAIRTIRGVNRMAELISRKQAIEWLVEQNLKDWTPQHTKQILIYGVFPFAGLSNKDLEKIWNDGHKDDPRHPVKCEIIGTDYSMSDYEAMARAVHLIFGKR